MEAHSFPPAVCTHVFIWVTGSKDIWEMRAKGMGNHLVFMSCRRIKIPVAPLLKGNIPIVPESDQSCSVPINERWTTVSQSRMSENKICRNYFGQLTTSLHKNVDHQSVAVLHRNSGRSDSRRRRGARGNGLVPDKKIYVVKVYVIYDSVYTLMTSNDPKYEEQYLLILVIITTI